MLDLAAKMEAKMATAYVYFGKPINSETATALVSACKLIVTERDGSGNRLWDSIHLSIASGGGDIIAAFSIYNELKALEVSLTTHNIGAVDSATILIFISGTRRLASKASAFFFHQVGWTFPGQGQLNASTVNDATKWLDTYEALMAETVEAHTNIAKDKVLQMMREGTSIRSGEARSIGLVHAVEELSIPWNARVQSA
jgi:ATP-dependent protease ClpP protease subunit